ncbi:hypothetical protein [Botrimarina sp.]|uniref:hypothetical protein n=1 Tax=Botrimarina sp. TaxID=2795802 RepID=UPI0032EE9432
MDTDPSPIAPALKALVDAGNGLAEIVDQETGRVFVIGEKTDPTVTDQYVSERLAEARADLDEGRCVADLPTESLLAEARRRRQERFSGEQPC